MRRKSIALLVVAMLLVVGSVAGVAGAGAGDRSSDEGWRMDARYWWEALPLAPHHQQQVREIAVLIFSRYFGTDISAISLKEVESVWHAMGHESQERALALFLQYATERGYQIPGMPAPRRDEFIPPPGATYWWEFVAPQYREAAIIMAKLEIPEMLRSYWELADWLGVELPLPRPEGLDVMRLTLEEYHRILTPPSFPLGRRSVREWIEKGFPGAKIIAVFGRTRLYCDAAGWIDRLFEVNNLLPIYPDLVNRFGVSARGINPAGYIEVWLDCRRLTVEEAELIARKLYAKISAKAEMVGIEDVPVVFILEAIIVQLASLPKDPRAHLGTPLPLDQKFRPIPGGAQKVIGESAATIGFPVWRRIFLWWGEADLTTTGHLGPGGTIVPVGTRVYQPVVAAGNHVGPIAQVARHSGFADVARIETPDRYVIPYIRTAITWTSPVLGWRDPKVGEMSGKFGRTTGRTSGNIYRVGVDTFNPAFGLLRNQVWAFITVRPGDSGSPLFRGDVKGVEVTGIAWGFVTTRPYLGVFSPVSGVTTELPGWGPYHR